MNICFIVGAMNVGGVQTFIINLSQYLIENGEHVSVIVTKKKGDWWHRLSEVGIEGVCLNQENFFSSATQSIAVANMIKTRKFDVVFLNHVRAGQISIPLYNEEPLVLPILHNDTRGVTAMALHNWKHWDYLIAVSPKLENSVKSKEIIKKIVQINYPIDMPNDVSFNSRRSWEKRIKLIYIGRIHEEQKGVMLLPNIIEQCNQNGLAVSLIIIGDGTDQDALEKRFGNDCLNTQVKFFGACSSDIIRKKLLDSHILLMPSHYEGLGIVAVEAQACGCVPIASCLPGVTDHSIIDNETGYLIKGREPKEYVRRIKKLSENKPRWEMMSRAGRNNVLQNFCIPLMGSKFHDLVYRNKAVHQKRCGFGRLWSFVIGTKVRDWLPFRIKEILRSLNK